MYLATSLEQEEYITLAKPLLKRCGLALRSTGTASAESPAPPPLSRARITLRQSARDVHTYVFARWVLDLLQEEASMLSLRDDLVPYLLGRQFREVDGAAGVG